MTAEDPVIAFVRALDQLDTLLGAPHEREAATAKRAQVAALRDAALATGRLKRYVHQGREWFTL